MFVIFDDLSIILEIERRRDYNNQTFLEKYASNFQKQALQEASTGEEQRIVQEITQKLRIYPQIPFNKRSNHIEQILALIEGQSSPSSSPQIQESGAENNEFIRRKEQLLLEIEKLNIQQSNLSAEI